MSLFGSKKKKSRLYHMEVDDEGIDREICDFIVKTEKKISEFKRYLDNSSFTLSSDDLTGLRRMITEAREKIIHLQNDILTITQLKLKNQQFFIIKDDSYFSDKKSQLDKLSQLADKFIEIIEQHPSTAELKNELINNMIVDLMEMQKGIELILADDEQLRNIYKRIEEF